MDHELVDIIYSETHYMDKMVEDRKRRMEEKKIQIQKEEAAASAAAAAESKGFINIS